jgi:F0F1-type ATP synthase membrane subunit c/vacuolar-type H+-ATPase subunit K
MVHALLVLASIESHSKTAFYIAGGLLVAWAVLVAAYGIQRAEAGFPAGLSQQRALIGVTVVLVAAAVATSVITA